MEAYVENALLKPALVKVFADFARGLKGLSKCHDKQVACLICSGDLKQVYSIGINGGPSRDSDLECLCESNQTKYSCIHAEANALVKLQTRDAHKVMICTYSPCLQCASMIINEPCGFDAVLFMDLHHDYSAVKLLLHHGIQVGQVDKHGHIEWFGLSVE